MNFWSVRVVKAGRRRGVGSQLRFGSQTDRYESREMLSAAAIVATVPEACEVGGTSSAKVLQTIHSKTSTSVVPAAVPANFDGIWNLGPVAVTLNLIQGGKFITGTISVPYVGGTANDPLEGKVRGNRLIFRATSSIPGNPQQLTYKVTLSDPTHFSGTVKVNGLSPTAREPVSGVKV